jgi:hypothetical protein
MLTIHKTKNILLVGLETKHHWVSTMNIISSEYFI